jgi:hypothetical protein
VARGCGTECFREASPPCAGLHRGSDLPGSTKYKGCGARRTVTRVSRAYLRSCRHLVTLLSSEEIWPWNQAAPRLNRTCETAGGCRSASSSLSRTQPPDRWPGRARSYMPSAYCYANANVSRLSLFWSGIAIAPIWPWRRKIVTFVTSADCEERRLEECGPRSLRHWLSRFWARRRAPLGRCM